jgi:hypothetical protein
MPNGAGAERALSPSERRGLYAARRFLGLALEKKLGLRIPFDVYFQDPAVAEKDPKLRFNDDFSVPWEPGLADGPTSARFAVVDYNGDTGTLTPPAKWDDAEGVFLGSDGKPLKGDPDVKIVKANLQFHQVHAWAIVQNALDFYESGFGLGRKILWGFAGSRLIILPHAGYGENAYYDRESKSLQFYYFDNGGDTVYTCLSTDIVNHEFGHAVLDGIRPYFNEAITPETAAFHEFVGDLTAILVAFRNNAFRSKIGMETEGNLNTENTLTNIADEFGKATNNRPYLRSAINPRTMKDKDVAGGQKPHLMSEVLTGAVFEILFRLSRHYIDDRKHKVKAAFAFTIARIQQMAIQPLDLLPPVDATFRDYAIAMLRAEEIANPTDPDKYREMMFDIFVKRGILEESERDELLGVRHVFQRIANLAVFHDPETIASSRAEAYRFLDDNRDALFIPRFADVTVADLFTAQKLTREGRRLPQQIVLQYVWREDVMLQGERFGRFAGQATSLLCGGTLALDQNGNVMAWRRKPGSVKGGRGEQADKEAEEGARRKAQLLDSVARRVKAGRIGETLESPKGMVGGTIAPFTARTVDGALRFELSPHFGIHDDEHDEMGSAQWQISS